MDIDCQILKTLPVQNSRKKYGHWLSNSEILDCLRTIVKNMDIDCQILKTLTG